jgi:hypothetical protein
MRKIVARKLRMQQETVRHLSGREMVAVVAGADRGVTETATGCGPANPGVQATGTPG